jgi:hypothetical protein
MSYEAERLNDHSASCTKSWYLNFGFWYLKFKCLTSTSILLIQEKKDVSAGKGTHEHYIP